MKLAVSPFGNGAWGNLNVWPFDHYFKHAFNPLSTSTQTVKDADCLLLWGGEDIHPSFYNQSAHPYSESRTPTPSYRDVVEWEMCKEAYENNVPIIGVCRGAQLLCAFAGGKLIQHVPDGHKGSHNIETYNGLSIYAKANHHQMMMPDGTNHDLLAWSTGLSPQYQGETILNPLTEGMYIPKQIEPEVVYFRDVDGLAIQPHPEWHTRNDEDFVKFVLDCVDYFIVN